MHDKIRTFSDGRGDPEDLVHALGEDRSLEVSDRTTRRGILLLLNCQHCPRQISSILGWQEIVMMFLGQTFNPPQWKPTRQGVIVPLGCACGKMSPLTIDWDEVRKYKDVGVRSGCIDPRIDQAR